MALSTVAREVRSSIRLSATLSPFVPKDALVRMDVEGNDFSSLTWNLVTTYFLTLYFFFAIKKQLLPNPL